MQETKTEGKRSVKEWKDNLVKQDEIDRYLVNGKDFIDDDAIEAEIEKNKNPSPERIRKIIKKAYEIKLMDSADVAALMHVTDPDLKEEIFTAAREIKTQVYDNR
ncbi:MAG TPA: [FeFe] hydrogenase H-cluster radical SAM maturase HydG, partial [Treponema sp.]|nr:[FeFe] hydrogenase H-cluster radical SAM maturase HydG [Treponema sp.]